MQNKIQYFFFAALCFLYVPSLAQNAIFLSKGNITFEKKVNTYALLKGRIGDDDQDGWSQMELDAAKKNNNGFTVTHFNLAFKNGKTLYTPIQEDDASPSMFSSRAPASDNTVYSDLDKSQSVSQKTVYEDKFLITDSTRKIRWKITDEIRDIQGFHCRRANAVIMDSIYVVAFYTNQIAVSGGPESFSGLPGMILEVALPHLHTVWTATKITLNSPATDGELLPPAKGIAVTKEQFLDKLKSSLKDWGSYASVIIQNAML